jgi:hypothetical protein
VKLTAQFNRTLFWLMIALGVVCMGVGGSFAWLDHAAIQESEYRHDWVDGEARLYEVGIRRSAPNTGADYEMTARYVLTVGGRDHEGTRIAGSYRSKSPAEVRSLIVPFAAEAAEFSLQDLGPLNPQRTWNVAYRPVKARYDPRDPARSEILLAPDGWLPSGIGMTLLLAGTALCVLAWPVARRRKSRPPDP